MTRIERHPKLVSIVISLGAGVAAVLLVANNSGQSQAVILQTVGLAVFVLGVTAHRKRHPFVGWLLSIVGIGIALVAIGLGLIQAGTPSAEMELLPGMVGLVILAVGVTGIRDGWERGLIAAGTAGLLVGLLMSGLVHGATTAALLGSAVATVVAWDAGEQGVNLGEQVGSRAVTWSSELAHVAGTTLVGVIGVTLAFGAYGIGVDDVPLAGLFLLLIGAVTLTAALYN